MVDISMKRHLGSDNACNTVNLHCPKKFLQGMTNTIRLTLSVGDTRPWFTNSIEHDN